MALGRLHRGVLGAGLAALGVASAVAVAVDASPVTVAVAALLGAATALGGARARSGRTRNPPRTGPSEPASSLATLAVLFAAAAAWVLLGTALAGSLDEAGVPKRSALFAFTDGLVAAAGILLARGRIS